MFPFQRRFHTPDFYVRLHRLAKRSHLSYLDYLSIVGSRETQETRLAGEHFKQTEERYFFHGDYLMVITNDSKYVCTSYRCTY